MLGEVRIFWNNPYHPALITKALQEIRTWTWGAAGCVDYRVRTGEDEHRGDTAI